jgi:hypothetical protein
MQRTFRRPAILSFLIIALSTVAEPAPILAQAPPTEPEIIQAIRSTAWQLRSQSERTFSSALADLSGRMDETEAGLQLGQFTLQIRGFAELIYRPGIRLAQIAAATVPISTTVADVNAAIAPLGDGQHYFRMRNAWLMARRSFDNIRRQANLPVPGPTSEMGVHRP